jgi:hypothetical protein
MKTGAPQCRACEPCAQLAIRRAVAQLQALVQLATAAAVHGAGTALSLRNLDAQSRTFYATLTRAFLSSVHH